MTREEAIEILRCVPSSEIGNYSLDEISEALTMAIEALQKPPISQRRMYQAGYRQGREETLKQVTGKLNNPDDSLLTADSEACKEQKSKLDLISRAEAIEAIDIVDWYHQNSNKDMVHGANDEHQAWYKADDVYKALEAIPSANRPKDGDLISRVKVIETVGDWMVKEFGYLDLNRGERLINAIEALPSADRPRGEWIEETSWKYKKGGRNSDMKEILGTEWMTMIRQRCSECNKVTMVDGSILYKYCPHCGSEMRGDTE